jgi:hypothetical protein
VLLWVQVARQVAHRALAQEAAAEQVVSVAIVLQLAAQVVVLTQNSGLLVELVPVAILILQVAMAV